MLTPQTVDIILRNAHPRYKACHDLNAANPLVSGCKVGAVFAYDGAYYVYIGVKGGSKKPVVAVHSETRRAYRFAASFFERVRKAST